MSKIWLTSDTHYGHANMILKFGRDMFNSVSHMDEELIRRYNSVVGDDDIVYFLGDLTYYGSDKLLAILSRLNGKEKHLILGNHDKVIRKNVEKFKKVFVDISEYKELDYNKKRIILSHYPFEEWNGKFRKSYHFHGHCHGKIDDRNKDNRRKDVGVDSWDYYPVNIDVVLRIIDEQMRKPIYD